MNSVSGITTLRLPTSSATHYFSPHFSLTPRRGTTWHRRKSLSSRWLTKSYSGKYSRLTVKHQRKLSIWKVEMSQSDSSSWHGGSTFFTTSSTRKSDACLVAEVPHYDDLLRENREKIINVSRLLLLKYKQFITPSAPSPSAAAPLLNLCRWIGK